MRKFTPWMAIVAAGVVGLAGCATKDFVREQVGGVDSKVKATQAQVDAQQGRLQGHDARLGDLDKNTREALDRAQAAGKLAEGKFLYSMVLSDDSVKFPVNGSDLSAEAKTRLTDFAVKLKAENKNVFIEIQGHTDASGKPAKNQALGAERAEAVRRFLNQQGVALNRMSTISYGADSPVAPNTTKEGKAQNRRVVVIVLN